jgi:hypothetical protein
MKSHIDPKLKPLYANLLKVGIGKYLVSERYHYLCIENDIDQLWDRCKGYIQILNIGMSASEYTSDEEDALAVFLTELFTEYQSSFISVMSKIMIDFADWDKETKDFSKVIESLLTLGYAEDDLEEMLAGLKKEKIKFTTSQQKITKLQTGEKAIDETLCFVLMPFDEKFVSIYDAIKKVVESFKLKCLRADEIFGTQPIIQDILEHMQKAKFLIADLTGRNPNVFYELGLAHAMGKEVILVTQDLKDVPFDLEHYRCIVYKDSVAGAEKLKKGLKSTLKKVISKG